MRRLASKDHKSGARAARVRWFAAHLITFSEWKDPGQDTFVVWDNVCLFSAESVREAWKKAQRIGDRDYDSKDYSATVSGHKARQRFVGGRKVITCSPDDIELSFRFPEEDYVEVSYSEFEVSSKRAVSDIAKGQKVDLRYTM